MKLVLIIAEDDQRNLYLGKNVMDGLINQSNPCIHTTKQSHLACNKHLKRSMNDFVKVKKSRLLLGSLVMEV